MRAIPKVGERREMNCWDEAGKMAASHEAEEQIGGAKIRKGCSPRSAKNGCSTGIHDA
jgi:hypothetical protein